MEENLLFTDCKIILKEITKLLFSVKSGLDSAAITATQDIISHLSTLIPYLTQEGIPTDDILQALQQILTVQEQGDTILMADYMELLLYPAIETLLHDAMSAQDIQAVDYLASNLQILEAGNKTLANQIRTASPAAGLTYQVEYVNTGEITIQLQSSTGCAYLSGNKNPYLDALLYVQSNLTSEDTSVVLIGAGLLYEAEAILELRPDISLKVVEWDPYLLRTILQHRDCTELVKNENFQLCSGTLADQLTPELLQDRKLLIRKSQLRFIPDQPVKELLENFYMNYASAKENYPLLYANFYKNIRTPHKVLDDLKETFLHQTVCYVGGGPSLDPALERLRSLADTSVILCAGTSASKLVKNDIIPDYIIITDPNPAIRDQIAAYQEAVAEKNNTLCEMSADNMTSAPLQTTRKSDQKKTALLFLSSACHEAVRIFTGDKYLLCQNGLDKAQDYAASHHITLVETGGSVSTTALDAALRLGCDTLLCFGLDLAYTGYQTHASQTLGQKAIAKEAVHRYVTSVSGEQIPTSTNLDIYRTWIENRIRAVTGVKMINYSGGAVIHGMENRLV